MKIVHCEQGTEEWLKLRLGKVTGTRIKEVMAKDNLGLVDEIIAELVSEQAEEGYVNASMQRGTDYEPLARDQYEKQTGVKVDEFGFLIHKNYEWLGMSPDGLVKNESGVYTHGIEIKCPNTATHVRYIRQNQVPNEYKYQVKAMFLINENLKTHDFISYDNRFSVKPLHVARTTREEIAEELLVIEEALVKFWDKVMKYHDKVIF